MSDSLSLAETGFSFSSPTATLVPIPKWTFNEPKAYSIPLRWSKREKRYCHHPESNEGSSHIACTSETLYH